MADEQIRAFPLIPQHITNDYPTWDGGGIPAQLEEEILTLEHEERLDYFEDIVEDLYPLHKIGGYQAFVKVALISVTMRHLSSKLPPMQKHV